MSMRGKFRLFDHIIGLMVSKTREMEHPIACDSCKKPGCCKLLILANPDEGMAIAEYIMEEKPYLLKDLTYWVKKYLRLPLEVAAEPAEMFRSQRACPFLKNGKCSVYEVRPLTCRGYYAIEEDSSKCNDTKEGGVSVRQLDTYQAHMAVRDPDSPWAYSMPLLVFTLIGKGSMVLKARTRMVEMSDIQVKHIIDTEGAEVMRVRASQLQMLEGGKLE